MRGKHDGVGPQVSRPFIDGLKYAVFCIWEAPIAIVGGIGIGRGSDDIEAFFLTQVVRDISP